jgi:hypothetical protein
MEHPLTPVGKPRRVRDVLHQISAKHLAVLEENENIEHCCRKAKDHTVELFKTHPDLKEANLMILTCQCGRKHHRIAAGPGQTSAA